jgi:hypothetical protein
MDKDLTELLKTDKKAEAAIKFVDDEGSIEIQNKSGRHPYRLKPLGELYGTGINAGTVDPQSQEYMPLFLCLEEAVMEFWKQEPQLIDGQVQAAYDQVAISPEGAAGDNLLVEGLQLTLRLQLSLNDFSRRDVQRVLRRLSRSVALHTREGGRRGYLTFLRQYMP